MNDGHMVASHSIIKITKQKKKKKKKKKKKNIQMDFCDNLTER